MSQHLAKQRNERYWVEKGIQARKRSDGTVGYYAKVYDPATRSMAWLPVEDSLSAAQKARRKAFQAPRPNGRMRVAEYAEVWLRLHPKSESTARTYAYGVKAFVEEMERKWLDAITRIDARDFASRHANSHVDPVRTMLNDALDDGLIVVNHFARLGNKRSVGRKYIEIISTEELFELSDLALEVLEPPMGVTMREMIRFAANSAMRPAELFAMEWSWIDGENGEIVVPGQLGRNGKFKPRKNGKPARIILLAEAREALMRLPRRLHSSKVFLTARGRPFSQSKLHYYWNPIRSRAGRPEMDFYDLRHYCGKLLYAVNGLSADTVAIQFGHTDGGKKVQELYGHPDEDLARERIRAADRQGLREIPRRKLELDRARPRSAPESR